MELAKICLPYCLKRLDDGRYVVLNRWYKPMGMMTREHVDYDDHALHIPGLRAKTAALLSWERCESLETIFLYTDSCGPTRSTAAWDAYARRLRHLNGLTLRGPI